MDDVITVEHRIRVDADTEETLLFSERGKALQSTDTPADAPIRELLLDAGNFRRELFSGARVSGVVTASIGQVRYLNQGGTLDYLRERAIAGGRLIVRQGPVDAPFPSGHRTLYVAYAQSAVVDLDEVRVTLADRSKKLDSPVVTEVFAGTGGLEGTGIAQTKKQMVFGRPGYIRLILVDPVKLIYFLQANATDGVAQFGTQDPVYVWQGAIKLSRGTNYEDRDELLSVSPDEGFFRMWGGQESVTTHATGPIYIRLGSPPAYDVRFGARGFLQNEVNGPIGFWRLSDLCNRAGMLDITPETLAPQSVDQTAGNLLVDGNQTFRDVMNNVGAARQAAYGFTAQDLFFAYELKDPGDESDPGDVSRFTFTEGNNTRIQAIAIPGLEAPVWQVSVSAGRTWPGSIANGATAENREIFSRGPWNTVFTGTNDAVKAANPGAQSVSLEIEGNEFPDRDTKQAFVNRFLRLYGGRRDMLQVTCAKWDEETLGIELHDKVTVQMDRLGCDDGRSFRVVFIDTRPKDRSIVFGLWGGDPGPSESVLGGGTSPPGGGGGGSGVVPGAALFGLFRMAAFTQTALVSVSRAAGFAIEQLMGLITQTTRVSVVTPPNTGVLMLHFDGNFTDSSASAHTVTANGGISRTSGTVKFGSEAVTFDGSNDSLGIADSTDWPSGTAVFSVDFWIYIPTSTTLTGDNTAICHWATNQISWWVGFDSSARLRLYHSADGTNGFFRTLSASGLSRDAWHHIAVWRSPSAGVIQGAIDGTLQTNDYAPAGTSLHNSTAELRIGCTGHNTAFMPNGVVMDEVRVCTGTIDYDNSSFTPPSAPY